MTSRELLKRIARKIKRTTVGGVEQVLPDPITSFTKIVRRHKRLFGVFPNLILPKTFNEKVLCRILFDRRPIWTTLNDKYAVRDYVRQKIGEDVLPEWYFVTKNPSTIPFDDLPNRFVVKPTHGSHWVRLVPDKALLDKQDLIDTCLFWLKQNYYYVSREWAYKHIEPRIVVEEFICDSTGPMPTNYRLHVFDGRVKLILADVGAGEVRRFVHYSRSWDKLRIPCRFKDVELACPKRLEDMVRYAEILDDGLDFVRVDMYHTQDKVYFGEATTTPMAGTMTTYPHEF